MRMGVHEPKTGDFSVDRGILDELSLDEVARKRTCPRGPSLKERLRESARCSLPRLKVWLFSWLPVLSWLPRYKIRENGLGDLIAGISVGIMHLPQGMAYALLASLPPVYGLYTSFYPVLVYFIFGTSRHISVGTFAVISIMIGSLVERLAPDANFNPNITSNGSSVVEVDVAARDAYRVQIATALTLCCGLFQVVLGLVKFGFVVTYLSEPLVRGYTTGAATHVVISQLKYLFEISPERFAGPLSQIYTLIDLCHRLPSTNIPTLVVSLVALAVLIIVKELNSYYSKKLPLPIPIELIVIIGATVISYYGNLNEIYNVHVVGEIPSGLVPPRVPDFSLFPSVVGEAFAIAVVGYAINISLGKTFSLKHGYKVDSNQELVALGLSNTVGSLFQCYSVTSSLSRSLIQESTGGKTQVAGVVSGLIVLVTVLKLGSLFEELPKAVLATIVFVNLKGMFKQYMDIPALWKSNKVDLLIWVVTCTCTILLNLDLGLAVSVAFSLLTVIFRTQLPKYYLLGWVPGTELYLDTETYEEAKEIPGVTIFRSSATVYFANAELYREALEDKSGININKLLKQKKKQAAKQKRLQTKEEKRAQKQKTKENGMVNVAANGTAHPVHKETDSVHWRGSNADLRRDSHCGNGVAPHSANGSVTNGSVTNGSVTNGCVTNGCVTNGCINKGFGQEPDAHTCDVGDERTDDTIWEEVRSTEVSSGSGKHSIILDLSTVGFADTVTLNTLTNICRDFGEVDVTVYLAGCQVCVVQQLERGDFFATSIPKSRLFPSIHDAVLHCLNQRGKELPIYGCVLEIACVTQL
ncbi:solute carrier family 26 member 6 [Alosa sapidissima]|uniref:solute carrier family 26 member 6 n=1 Tax=Alosa sapidissima TaxID=34773 RepID=UPI001C096DC7|nr:solute carrier family 26 member 6 [Alosa sapidissima]